MINCNLDSEKITLTLQHLHHFISSYISNKTNLKIKISEMCLSDCISLNMLRWFLSYLGNVWMYGDIITDGLTVYFVYWVSYESGKLSACFWIFGVIFMILPTLVRSLVTCKVLLRDPFTWCIHGPFYSLSTPAQLAKI